MRTTFESLRQHLELAARGLGFDEKLEKPLGPGHLRVRVIDTTDGDALRVTRLEVSAPLEAPLSLRARRHTFGAALGVALGVYVPVLSGDLALDAAALLETAESARVRAAVKAGLGTAVRELLSAHPDARLEVQGSRLVLSLEGAEGCLARAIDFATRAALAIDASRIRPRERDAEVRCGFCHADLGADEGSVVRCARCKAPVHSACWADNEGCPVAGCEGAPR